MKWNKVRSSQVKSSHVKFCFSLIVGLEWFFFNHYSCWTSFDLENFKNCQSYSKMAIKDNPTHYWRNPYRRSYSLFKNLCYLGTNKQTSIFFLFDCHDDFSEGGVESTRKGVPDETRALNDVVLRVVTNPVQVNSKAIFVPEVATKQFDCINRKDLWCLKIKMTKIETKKKYNSMIVSEIIWFHT